MAFCALAAAAGIGAALLASGRRIAPPAALALGAAVVAWSAADWVLHLTSSPLTMLGRLGLAPLEGATWGAYSAAGVVVVGGLLAAGLASVGGTSLEDSLRRAGLVAQLRFAVTVQDLRTVILLRRQLAAELPRSRPWIALRPKAGGTVGAAVWRRGWRSYLRWPAARVVRVAVLGLVAGFALLGAWRGTTPLVIVAGCALLLAALDVIEPLAQEIDHPTRRSLLPLRSRPLLRPHLVAPTAVLLLVSLAGVAAVLAVARDSLALEVGLGAIVPAALGALAGAAVSVITDPFQWVLIPAAQNVRAIAPFALATLGVLPVLGARYAVDHGLRPAGALIQIGLVVSLLCVGVLTVLTGWLAPKDAS
jgi:hypothetical protein